MVGSVEYFGITSRIESENTSVIPWSFHFNCSLSSGSKNRSGKNPEKPIRCDDRMKTEMPPVMVKIAFVSFQCFQDQFSSVFG